MKKLIRCVDQQGVVAGYLFWCPGCEELHQYTVPRWQFNENMEFPTFSPSLLYPSKVPLCHIFLTDGRIQFLSDCGHKLAGQTVDLPPLPDYLQDRKDF